MEWDHCSFEASHSEIVKDACDMISWFSLKFFYGVHILLFLVDIVGWQCLEVVYILLLSKFDDKIHMFSVNFALKNFLKGVFELICIMEVEFLHVKGEVGAHFIVKFIEVLILKGILALNLP